MKRLLLSLLLFAGASPLFAADYYWVGGAGNWSDINHWATTSGGTTKHSIAPSPDDNVFFDANSGIISSSVIFLPATGHAFCKNLSFAGVTTDGVFRYSNDSYTLYVYGNLELSSTMYYGTMGISFAGTANSTIKCNNARRINSAGWYNPFFINKPGATVTLLDGIPLDLQVNDLQLLAGNLDLSGRSHSFWSMSCNHNTAAGIDISNATINSTRNWNVRGLNKTVTTTNSIINCANLFTDGGIYNEVNVSGTNTDFAVASTTFDRLTFVTPTSVAGSVRINGNNIINTLEFKGGGMLRFGGNVINNLIVAPGKGLMLYGNNTVNSLFRMNTPACSGLGELTGTTSEVVTLTFGSSAVLDLNNVYVSNIIAAGGISLPVNVVGADGGNNTNWNITNPLTGTTMYWVGGAGDWNDNSHWAATSGGAGGYCVPFIADNVIFDANSGFTAGNNTVTTSSNSWCNNMTWTGIAVPSVFNEHGSYTLEVYGSLVMDPKVVMNANLLFKGTAASTLTTNGSGLGGFGIEISRTGTDGGLTLTDDFVNQNATLRLTLGKLLLPGRTLDLFYFAANTSGTRTIDMSNATVSVRETFTITGTGRTWVNNGAGLSVTSARYFVVDGLNYPTVTLSSLENVFDIRNASFGTLTFTNTSGSSLARILTNNTINTLEFKGSGNIAGTGNTIGTLLLAPSKYYGFTGTNTINTHFRFNSPACSGLGEMKGINNLISTLNFGASATTDLANVYLQNIAATGSITPLVVSGADAGGNTGFTINTSAGSNRYWVGGAGDWNDAAHWSLTPGGTGGACIPTVNDNVFFTAQSFTAANQTVTTTGNVYMKNMDWTGATSTPIFNESGSFNMEVWGNLVMNPVVTMTATAVFMGPDNATVTNNGSTKGAFSITVNKPGIASSLTLLDNISNLQTVITVTRGKLDASNRTLNTFSITDNNSTLPTAIDITNTNFTGHWGYTGTTKTLTATNSMITATNFFANGGTYNRVTAATGNSANVTVNNATISSLRLINTAPTAEINIGSNNSIDTLEFKGKGNIGTNNTFGTLIFAPARSYSFINNSNNTITNAWYGSGTPCTPTDISSPGTATVTVNGDPVNLDYVLLTGIRAAGTAAPFRAYAHSRDQGRNSNWVIDPYAGSSPILGLGPDITITTDDLPYTLNTSGFFGSPMSSYLWNDNSTADTMNINAAGTYSVNVSFPDGCSISDNITIAVTWPLPITLTSFSVKSVNCAPVLSWETADAVNFHRFEIERSTDGRSFVNIGSINFNNSVSRYSYTDNNAGEARFFYRLRLVDIDARYEFSNIINLRNNCGGILDVTPTVTTDVVNVTLPGGYENARIRVFGATGQELQPRISGNGSRRTVDLSALATGYYFLQVNNGVDMKTFKVMKK